MYVKDFIDCEMEMSACTRSRLYPIAPNNSRIPKDTVLLLLCCTILQTYIIMPIRVAGALPYNFPEPEVYKPERWSRKNKDTPNVFASLPFGFGVRMCVGQFSTAIVCCVPTCTYTR